ncbi:hypothetical protein GCM10023354_21600 [Garicola koreensis]|uniref:hypothetical protein n=1 Tax=Garicola koreensis TaxID=1262554 RepID=UPI0031F18BF9
MKYAPLALAALAGAAALAAFAWLGVAALTAVVCVLCALVSLGWPQLMGLTARRSLSAVIFAAGAAAAVGAAIVTRVESLFFWSAVALAFGVMVVFVVQVLRGAGRPNRLESTLGACAGVVVTTMAAGWVAGLRYPAGMEDGEPGDAGMDLLRVRGLFPYEDWGLLGVTGPGGELSVISLAAFALIAGTLAACLPVRDAVALPVTVFAAVAAAVTTALLWGELTLLFAGTLGVAAGALLASFRRFLVLQGVPAGVLPKLAVGSAPIAVMGGLVYFTERLLLA